MAKKFALDHAGMAEMLTSTFMLGAVVKAANAVRASAAAAPEIGRHDAPVDTTSGVSDRARAIVTIMHPGGRGMQAKHGTLSQAVAASGLKFKPSKKATP